MQHRLTMPRAALDAVVSDILDARQRHAGALVCAIGVASIHATIERVFWWVWRVNLDERRATIWMRTVSRRVNHARHLIVAGQLYSAGGVSLGLGTPTFLGVA